MGLGTEVVDRYPWVRSDKVASNLGSRFATSEGMKPRFAVTKCRLPER
jgi:hypothetical protein